MVQKKWYVPAGNPRMVGVGRDSDERRAEDPGLERGTIGDREVVRNVLVLVAGSWADGTALI